MNKVQKVYNQYKSKWWVWLILIGVILLMLYKPISSLFKSLTDAFKGITDATGITDSNGLKQAKDDASLSAFNPDYYTKFKNSVHISQTVIDTAASDIYDSWGFFSKNFEKTMSAIKRASNQVEVSAICASFQTQYNKDLLTFISPLTWTLSFRNYPTGSEFEMIHNYVTKLPRS